MTGRRGGELGHTEQAADRVERSSHVNVEMSVDATGDWARGIYSCQRRPFLLL